MKLSEAAFARRVLLGRSLDDKLVDAEVVAESGPETACPDVTFAAPGRPDGLGFGEREAMPFPKRESLDSAHVRGQVLHFFANHELLAMELMALALLRFPDAPAAFRQGLVRTIQEEQSHMRLYLGRMAELGVGFGELGVSDFFWGALKDVRTPYEFVAGMALTLEQANLDFSRHYRDQFAAAGDAGTAAILDRVYREEIGHVKHGLAWFERWRPADGQDLWSAYVDSLTLPLSPARAKAPPFNREGRLAAGLSEEFVSRLELFGGSKGRPPVVHWYNPDVEMEVAHALAQDGKARTWDGYRAPATVAALRREQEGILTFLAKTGDIVLCTAEPALELLGCWRDLGVTLPEYRVAADPLVTVPALAKERALEGLSPWGWGPRGLKMASGLKSEGFDKDAARSRLRAWYAKTELPGVRAALREELGAASLGPAQMDGRVVSNARELAAFAAEVHAATGGPVLVKAPFSAAGRERIKLAAAGGAFPNAELAWLERSWHRWGSLLAEPFVEIVRDLSLVADSSQGPERAVITQFFCDGRGKYLGHVLSPADTGAYAPALRIAAGHAFARLRATGHHGRAAIDAFVYRLPQSRSPDTTYLQALSEVNPRTTMGHVATALARLVAPGTPALWLLLAAAGVNPAELQSRFPRRLAGRPPRLAEGVFFTNDPAHASLSLGVVAAGLEAVAALRQMGCLTAP